MITWDRGVSVLSKYTKYYNSNSYEPLSEGGCTITMDRRWLVYCQNTRTIVIGMNHSLSEGGWVIIWDRGPSASIW